MKFFAPVFAWLVALAVLLGAVHELRRHQELSGMTAVLAALPALNLKSSPLTLADYQAIQQKTAVFGSVALVPAQGSLVIKAAGITDYAAWRLTTDRVLLDNPGVVWRIDYLCSGKCPTGEAHKAILTGLRRSSGI